MTLVSLMNGLMAAETLVALVNLFTDQGFGVE
jgi:hypothetical protein